MFAVLSVESTPNHLRGYISRFLTEMHTGLYAGVVTPRVSDALWEQVVSKTDGGWAVMITSNKELETGFDIRMHQSPTHRIADLDGLRLPVKRSRFKE